jgi:hypothetical protein
MRQQAVKERMLALLLLAIGCGFSSPAHAADDVAPVATGAPEENGLKVGAGRMHPFVDLEGRYDSNVVLDPQTLEPRSDFILHVRPGFLLHVPSRSLHLDLGGFLDYNKYLGVFTPNTRSLDRLLADADASFFINPEGAVAARLGGHFIRTDQTTQLLLGQSVIANTFQGRFDLVIQPGGKALVFEPGYVLDYQRFDPVVSELPPTCAPGELTCDPSVANQYNNIRHTAVLNARWRFFPKTALVMDSSLSSAQFVNQSAFDSLNFKLQAGLQGLLTNRFSVIAKLGWGFQPGDATFSSMIGQFELGYLASELAQLRLGYVRTYEPAPVQGGNYRDDRVYAEGRTILGGRVLLHATFGYDFLNYANSQSFDQLRVEGGPDFQVTDWFVPGLGAAYTQRISSNTPGSFDYDYDRVEAWLRLKFVY